MHLNGDIVLDFDRVSKKFCKNLKKSIIYGINDIGRNAVGLSSRPGRLRDGEFWAVDNVSFRVNRGESVGLIGVNGSGKSTMLKMVNGIFWPDAGKITVKGKVGALIEVGAGFHPLLTGRENIYINAAILGMSKSEVDARAESIIRFAEIDDFIDVPIKHYSSGMLVRLGFSIAVHSEPDILLIDEILAVGDRNFQIKCFRKLHELKKDNDITSLMVSHNEYAIREYTEKCAILDRGKMLFYGDTEDAITCYINMMNRRMNDCGDGGGSACGDLITRVVFRDGDGRESSCLGTGGKLVIDFEYETDRIVRSPIFGINLRNQGGEITGFWNSYAGVTLPDIIGKGTVRVQIDPLDLPVDVYQCSIVLCEEEESNVLEWTDICQRLVIERKNNTRGYLRLRQTWRVLS